MNGSKVQETVREILAPADIQFEGNRPWDIQVNNSDFYQRILAGGSLALGESYMDGWWDCEALDEFFARLLKNRINEKAKTVIKSVPLEGVKAMMFNAQNRTKAFIIGKRHYDIGNDLFSLMLDKGLNYSCGYWHEAETLDEAQTAKCELICRKIGLKPGMKVLDIGCGWGGFAQYAAAEYGAGVYGITVSSEQASYAKQCCHGLDVEIDLKDYRDIEGEFDAAVSIGMVEHVGYKNYRTFMEVVYRCLKPGAVFLLHTIGGNTSANGVDPWIEKYIFPNSMLPSAKQITAASEGLLILEDWHCFGPYYDKTLMKWYDNFQNSWENLKDRYDDQFYRMWEYYLLSCAGSFRAKHNQLWQVVFSRDGIDGVFRNSDQFFI